jgi:hypothetical protein
LVSAAKRSTRPSRLQFDLGVSARSAMRSSLPPRKRDGRRLDRARGGFAAKPGWCVVIDAGKSEPLWPQGFDPLNVERVGAERVLHTRFLRLGNGAGRLEVLNAEALTDGVGPHPLFQGVRRVQLTGLAEPQLSEAEGKVGVRAPGLTLEFIGALVAQGDRLITVQVGSQ